MRKKIHIHTDVTDLLGQFSHPSSSATIKINIYEHIFLDWPAKEWPAKYSVISKVNYSIYQSLFVFSGCPVAIKRRGSSKRIALAAAAMMAMDSDVTQGASVSSAHPLHLLSLSPIKLPFLMTPHAGRSTTEKAFISDPILSAVLGSNLLKVVIRSLNYTLHWQQLRCFQNSDFFSVNMPWYNCHKGLWIIQECMIVNMLLLL